MHKQFKLSIAAAAVAAAFAVPSANATVIVGAGASAVNNAALAFVINSYCGGATVASGSISYYDSSASAQTALAKGNQWAVSCTPVASASLTATTLNVSYDISGGSWKSLQSANANLVTAAQNEYTTLAAGGTTSQNVVLTIDPAATTCSGNGGTATTLAVTLADAVKVTLSYNYGCSTQAVGLNGNTDIVTFGFSDVEPKLFATSGANQPEQWLSWLSAPTALMDGSTYSTFSFSTGAELTGYPKQAFGVVFGVAASGPLWLAMQQDQLDGGILPTAVCGTAAAYTSNELCTPMISREAYASLVSNAGGSSLNSAANLFSTDTTYGTATILELARRDQGSGTQASSNAFFLNNGCTLATTESADGVALPSNSAYNGGAGADLNAITYNLSTGEVINRLQGNISTNSNSGIPVPSSNFVIGVVSGEKYSTSTITGTGAFGTSTAPWGFLRVDGALPTTKRVQQGLYSYTTTEFFHCNKNATADGLKFCGDATTATNSDSVQSYSAGSNGGSQPTGIYPIASTATIGTYYTNGKTCSGPRHH